MDIGKLLVVLEGAKEGSEYLDYAIQRQFRTAKPVPTYTRSIDAALSLVPEGWSLHRLTHLGDCQGGFAGWIGEVYRPGDAVIRYPATGPTASAPLAICLAALRVHRGETLRAAAMAAVTAAEADTPVAPSEAHVTDPVRCSGT
jgi:hypothetical protein